MATDKLVSGHTRSCGCLQRESRHRLVHGHARQDQETPEFRTWMGMVTRCFNPNAKDFPAYGGRGITVCDRWMEPDGRGFLNFLHDMGKKPSPQHSIDRYPDNDGHYCPENCRWATRSQQQRNTSQNVILEFNGEQKTMVEWAEEVGIPYGSLQRRISQGWSTAAALTIPVKRRTILN